MKKILCVPVLLGIILPACAQGYFGAVAALSSTGLDCSSTLSCDKKGFALKVYGGTKLAPSSQLDLGVARLDAVEFSAINFGKVGSSGPTTVKRYNVNTFALESVAVDASTVNTANAITASAVINAPISQDFTAAARVGIAYVSATTRRYVDGTSNASETQTKFQPYLGLSAAYSVTDAVRLVGSYDFTRAPFVGRTANVSAYGVGAELTY